MQRLTTLIKSKLQRHSTLFFSPFHKEDLQVQHQTWAFDFSSKQKLPSLKPLYNQTLYFQNRRYFSSQKPSQTVHNIKERVSIRSRIKNYLSNTLLGGLILTILGGLIDYQAKSGLIYNYLDDFAKRQADNIILKKGKTIEDKIIAASEKQFKEERQSLPFFHFEDYSYREVIHKLLYSKDYKAINFIDCVIGNGVGSNLKRTIKKLIYSKEHSSKFGFNRLYYMSLGDPPIYEFKDSSEKSWHTAEQLHQLLNCLIDKDSLKQSILVVDQVQVLQTLFEDNSNNEKLNLLFNQLDYLQRRKNLKIFLLCNDATFYSKLMKRLDVLTIDSFRHQNIGTMTDRDIHEIVACRTKLREIQAIQIRNLDEKLKKINFSDNKSEQQSVKNDILAKQAHIKQRSQDIMNVIVNNHNNIRQIMRLLKAINMDLKPIDQKERKKKRKLDFLELVKLSLLKPLEKEALMQQLAGCMIFPIQFTPKIVRKPFTIHKIIQEEANRVNFDEIYNKIKQTSQEIIKSKIEYIYSEIFQSAVNKDTKKQDVQAERMITLQKIKLLYNISKNKYNTKEAELRFYANNNIHQLEAFRSLNTMEILHGLKLTSKSYEKACQIIIQRLNLTENVEQKFKLR